MHCLNACITLKILCSKLREKRVQTAVESILERFELTHLFFTFYYSTIEKLVKSDFSLTYKSQKRLKVASQFNAIFSISITTMGLVTAVLFGRALINNMKLLLKTTKYAKYLKFVGDYVKCVQNYGEIPIVHTIRQLY